MSAAADVRLLGRALATASDSALGRVIGLLENMAGRPDAQSLIDGVRFRLRTLRPPRPLLMARLLFMPLDGAIVEPGAWQRGSGRVPRSALLALTAQTQAAAGEGWTSLELRARGRQMDDRRAVALLGRPLWALAARALPDRPPADWRETTGLRMDDHGALARSCITVWQHAGPLWDAVEAAGGGLPEPLLRGALEHFTSDEAVFSACLATLMMHAASPWEVAGAACRLGPMPRMVAERALDGFIENSAPRIAGDDIGGSAARVHRFADVCEALEGHDGARPERRRRVAVLRKETDRVCREAYAAAMKDRFTPLLGDTAGLCADAGLEAAETLARDIRRLGLAGRRIGDGAAYDTVERPLPARAAGLIQAGLPEGLRRIEVARLVEVVCGSEAAAKLLNGSLTG